MKFAKPKVFLTGKLHAEAMARLEKSTMVHIQEEESNLPLSAEALIAQGKDVDAFVCLLGEGITKDVIDKCPELKLVANVAVGYDNVDIAYANKKGILVTNTPGVLDNATADLAMTLLLSCARRIGEAERFVRSGKWQGWCKQQWVGHDLLNKQLGIVGMGRIGLALARRAKAFGLKILYTRNTAVYDAKDKQYETELGAQKVTFEELLTRSDFISIHCPLTKNTYHLFGAKQFKLMKPGCILVNTARGAVVNESELTQVLQSGRLAAAGLDVFEYEPNVTEELLSLENVVLTPHIGSATAETLVAMDQLAVDSVLLAFSGKRPENIVNSEAWDLFQSRLLQGAQHV